MKRALILIALVALLAIVAVALSASAQTDPPDFGDWVISDSTSIPNRQVTITGSVRVIGNGHLSLSNVNLRFTGAVDHKITTTTNARLTIQGGTITSSGSNWKMESEGRTAINGCDMTSTDGILLNSWSTQVKNCTIDRAGGTAINVQPTGTYQGGMDISHNNVTNASGYGILISLPDMGNTEIWVICHGNNASGSLQDGIRVTATTEKGRFFLRSNEVYKNGGHGLYASLTVRVVEVRVDDVWAKNNTGDGVHVVVGCSIHHMKYLAGVTSIGNGGQGLLIDFTQTHWARPVFSNLYIEDNEGGGFAFRNFICATLKDSYNVNDGSQADYNAVNTVLEIYGTTHRKAMARVSGGAYLITSFRTLEFTATWQNGMPCRQNTVEFEDPAGNRLFYYTSDYDGYLGRHEEWDWMVKETRSVIRRSITAYLVGGQMRLTGPGIDFDRDYNENLVFFDNQAPDLTVVSPGSNHVQNYDNLTIRGTCLDAHSHARVVQISFDDEPLWKNKVWLNASGTSAWDFYLDPAPDSVFTIYVRAFDWANYPGGIYANITIMNVTVDTTAPSLTIIQPGPNTITNSSQITILGTTDADVITLTINGEYLNFSGGTFNKPLTLYEGNNTLVTVATDYAGNIAKDIRYILLDSIAPIIVVDQPRDGLRTNKDAVDMGGYTDLEGVAMTINGRSVEVSNGVWTSRISLVKGNNIIVIDAVDIAENHRVVNHEIYYDPDPPFIDIDEPADGGLVNSSIFVVRGRTDRDIKFNQITVNDIRIEVDELGYFRTNVTVVEEGSFDLVINATDWAGNEASRTVPLFIDLTPPVISNLSIADGDIVNTRVLTVEGQTEDGVTLYIENKIVVVRDGRFSTEVHMVEGENLITLRISDEAGNTRTVNPIVTLDTQQPQVFVDGVLNGVVKTEDNFYNVVGNTETTASVVIGYGSESDKTTEIVYVDSKGEFSHPVILGKNKTTWVTITATDYAGNTYTANFTVKRVEPEEPGFYEANSDVVWGIIFVVAAVLIAIPVVVMLMGTEYKRRLKRMGYSTGPVQAPPAQPAPPSALQAQVMAQQQPPQPPDQTPRPPRDDETPAAAPRPPRGDE